MKKIYLVTDQFTGSNGWTADKLSSALEGPLSRIGITVVRVAGHRQGGLQVEGLPLSENKYLHDKVGRIVKSILSNNPLSDKAIPVGKLTSQNDE